MDVNEFFELDAELLANGNIPVKKYRHKQSSLNVFFVDVDSQVINGYFCYGIDQPEGTGIETLLWHLDSSGGLLPRPMRGDMLRPSWQFHGAENPLADRDQSCFVCSALGEIAFLGTFACCVYLLQNLEAMFEIHGLSSAGQSAEPGKETQKIPISGYGAEPFNEGEGDAESEPQLNAQEFYLLSEPGEGAMAWEATLQSMFPGCRTFWNRLLSDANTKLSPKMRQCYDMYYRPENLSVIIAGTIKNHAHILETLHEYHTDFNYTHPKALPFVPPWSSPLPPCGPAGISEVRFLSRNPNRLPSCSVCFGWRGTKSSDMETALALKVLTAHLAVGPLWDQFVPSGVAHRITWCQLEYLETCDLITMHGIVGEENLEKVCKDTQGIIADMADSSKQALKLEDIQAMADRVGWHYVRELESDPFLMIAAAVAKAERYGRDSKEYLQKRLHPRAIFDDLLKKPIQYWQDLLQAYFVDKTFITKMLPKVSGDGNEVEKAETDKAAPQSEASEKQSFAATSKRASSRPRRRANPVGEESNVVDFHDGDGAKMVETEKAMKQLEIKENQGHIQEFLKNRSFPFGEHAEDAKGFEERLQMTSSFLEEVVQSNLLTYPLTSYQTDGPNQHPSFPLKEMPFFTFLEDLDTSFVYATLVLDTTHLDESTRKLISPIVAALGAMLCPRPPGLDTDAEITNPCEFNPAKNISDSQVSLGLNGEMMQSIFITMIVRPDSYEWLVGMFKFLLYSYEFPVNFLKFISAEASKGLASNYRMQTAEKPNFDAFDSSEINMYSLVKMVYKDDSNARLFVGRRRLDLMNDYLAKMSENPEEVGKNTNAGWRKIVDEGRVVLQIAGKISEIAAQQGDLVAPWKKCFDGLQKSRVFTDVKPTLEPEMMTAPGTNGISVAINHCRPACLTTAIKIDPNDKDFPKLCIAAQLFSMAQKWVWACMDEDDVPQPVLRMPCSYSNIMTLNLESYDVIGALEAMKEIIKEDWQWLNCMLIATKLMVVNDPSAVDQGPHGAIVSALMSHLSGQAATRRRDILMETLKVTVDDVKTVIRSHLSKLFDPKACWYALMAHGCDQTRLVDSLKEHGFDLEKKDLTELCTTL